jgi:signal transduction histidine kinase
MTISRRLMMVFLIVLVSMVTLAFYSVNTARKFLLDSVGKNSVFLAEEMMKKVEHSINDKIEFLQLRSKGYLLQNVLAESNREFESLDNIEEYIAQKDREWVSVPKGSITPFMKKLTDNRLSQQLRDEYIKFWIEEYGRTAFVEVFVTNRYGANVAQTARTTDYRQDDEQWWQIAKRDGVYVGGVEYDESAGSYGLVLAQRVEDEGHNFIGVIKAIMPITGIIKETELAAKRYQTTETKLITKKGQLIYATKSFRILEDISGKEFFKKIKQQSGFFISQEGGRKRIFSYVSSKGQIKFGGPQWILLVSHDTREIFNPIFILRSHILNASLIIIVLTVLVTLFISRSITMPIARLREGTDIIGKGNLDYKVGTEANDEVGQLSRAFDQMTENLKKVTASRDELNKEILVRKQAEAELKNTYEELKKAHRQLEESEAQLIQSEKMRTLGMVTAGIAHELNNPMMGMLNFVQYCIKHTPEDDRRYGILKDVEQEINRCISIVRNLLTFSRMSREGQQEYQKESLAAVLERTLQLLSFRIDTQHVTVTQHIDEETPDVWMKVSNIQQVFLNLITNALDVLEKAEKKEIHIQVHPEGEFVRTTIADTGCGITPENLKKIFDPFFTTRPPGQSTGLGLSICQSIVEEHGGRIICESEPGGGAKFEVLLPIKRERKEEV